MITAGIDAGSKFTKAVIVENGNMLSKGIVLTGFDQKMAAEESFEEALKKAAINRDNVNCVMATGAGQGEVNFAEARITDVSSAARGTIKLFPQARTVADVGEEEARALKMDESGNVLDFTINEKCAAGAGSFVETMAYALEVELEDMGKLSLQSDQAVPMNVQCTVFAESEVISLIHSNTPKKDIAKAIHEAIAGRISSMVRRIGLVNEMALIGGLAKNPGFVDALEDDLKVKLLLPEDPEFVSAHGAAIAAAERLGRKI